jgi:CRP-like cAMP-binding protein
VAPAERLLDLEAAPAPPAEVRRGGPPPRARTLPAGAVTLDQVALGKVVPTARRSQEISAVSEAAAYEIPLDDSLDDAFLSLFDQSDETAFPEVEIEAPAPEATAARDLFPRTPLFSSLDETSLRALIERVRLVHLEAGETAFRKGDPGDALYVVAAGEVAVFGGEDAQVEVARLGEGAFFGEIALVARQPRSASVVAATSTDLLAIDGAVLMELASEHPQVLAVILRFLRDRLLDLLVDTSPLFSPFSGQERQALAGRFRFIEAEPGAALVEQGKRAAGLFVLLSGEVHVTLDGKPVSDLGPGEIFGEMSMLSQGPAVATITAAGKCYLIQLPRADFSELIMTHPQVLEYMGDIADARQKELSDLRAGRAAYREGRLRML